jgi:hypothetical protein
VHCTGSSRAPPTRPSLSLKGCAPLTPSAVPSLTRQRARGVKTSLQTLSCLSWPNINTSGVDFDEKRALVVIVILLAFQSDLLL